jgi:hypothetical protein
MLEVDIALADVVLQQFRLELLKYLIDFLEILGCEEKFLGSQN